MNFNKVIIAGNITRDIELRYTPQGTTVTDICVAVNNHTGSGDNKKQETAFVDCTIWDKMAENVGKYLSKGSSVLVEGRLKQDTWEDKDTGAKRSKLKVVASLVQFGDKGDGGGESKASSGKPKPQKTQEEDFGDGQEIPF